MNVSNDQSKSRYWLQWRLGPSGHLTTFRLSREGTQDILPMSVRDGYIHAKWRKFLRKEKTKKKTTTKDLRDYQKSMKN